MGTVTERGYALQFFSKPLIYNISSLGNEHNALCKREQRKRNTIWELGFNIRVDCKDNGYPKPGVVFPRCDTEMIEIWIHGYGFHISGAATKCCHYKSKLPANCLLQHDRRSVCLNYNMYSLYLNQTSNHHRPEITQFIILLLNKPCQWKCGGQELELFVWYLNLLFALCRQEPDLGGADSIQQAAGSWVYSPIKRNRCDLTTFGRISRSKPDAPICLLNFLTHFQPLFKWI